MNIYDIAKEANVSISTVSRVINNSGAVSSKTRNKVEEIIKKSGYGPSLPAKNLASYKTKLVGVLIPDIRNNFHSQTAYEIDNILKKNGYTSILSNTSYDIDAKIDILKMQARQKVDSIITIGSTYNEEAFIEEAFKLSNSIPIVQVNSYSLKTVCVYCNEQDGMRQSLEYLSKNSYKNPIFVSDTKDVQNRAYGQKKLGFNNYLKKFYPNNEFIDINIGNEGGEISKILEYIDNNPDVDALQCENDNLAIRLYKSLKDKNVDIPKDIAIIGFDNTDATNYTQQKISSIDHKIHEHAKQAVDLMLRMLDGEIVEYNNEIKPKLVIKETS